MIAHKNKIITTPINTFSLDEEPNNAVSKSVATTAQETNNTIVKEKSE